jgi:hypothetical protein
MALSESVLLRASRGGPDLDLAGVFDFVDAVSGPGLAPAHAVVDAPGEREQLFAYLRCVGADDHRDGRRRPRSGRRHRGAGEPHRRRVDLG